MFIRRNSHPSEALMRGVYENPVGSGIWWIHYYAAGKRHREKVGRKSDAIKLYQSRKADAVAGRKLPELHNSKVVTLAELIDDALEFVAHHKDNRSYKSKAAIVTAALGSRPAAELTPQELERWLRGHSKRGPRPIATRPSSPFAIGKAFATAKSRSILPDSFASAKRAGDGCAFLAVRNTK
jgi:hypothetical protein